MKTKWYSSEKNCVAILSGVLLLLIGFWVRSSSPFTSSQMECSPGVLSLDVMGVLSYLSKGFCALGVLVASAALVMLLYKPFRELKWRVIGFVVVFFCGVLVYYQYLLVKCESIDSGVSLLATINNTFSIFFPSRGAYDDVHSSIAGVPQFSNIFLFCYYLVHIVAYIYGALLILSVLGGRMMNRARDLFRYKVKTRCLFFGYSEQSITLAKDILRKEEESLIVFVLPLSEKKNDELFERLDDLGVVVIYRQLDGSRMNKITDKRAAVVSRYFFLDEDEDWNVKLALKVVAQLQGTSLGIAPHLYIKSQIRGIDIVFNNLSNIEVHIFSQSDLTARHFIQQNRMLDCPGISIESPYVRGDFRLLVLGFGWTGREVMNKCICDSQFVGSSFSATVIDNEFEQKYGYYLALYDECIKEYALKIIEDKDIATAGSIAFYRWIEDNIVKYNRIIVALGSDKVNLEIAGGIAMMMNKRGIYDTSKYIFAHIREKECFGYFKDKNFAAISIFGEYDEVYTKRIVVNEQEDVIAAAVHYVYCKSEAYVDNLSGADCDSIWGREKNIFNRESSRAVALSVDNQLRIAGQSGSYTNAIWNPASLEVLAENEHLRWNAFHYTKGVRRWDLLDMADGEMETKRKYQGVPTHHSCLVKYAELPLIDEKINKNREVYNKTEQLKIGDDKFKRRENMKENDRRIVRHFLQFKQLTSYEKEQTI